MTPQKNGGILSVIYALVADASKTIANNFGVLAGDWNYNEEGQLIFERTPIAYIGTFFIDNERTVDAW